MINMKVSINVILLIIMNISYLTADVSVDMRYSEEDYILMNCWDCYNSCGKICKNKNNDAM